MSAGKPFNSNDFPTTWIHTPRYYIPYIPKPRDRSKYIRVFPSGKWKKGTKVNHPEIPLPGEAVKGFSRRVFHPPKNLLSSFS